MLFDTIPVGSLETNCYLIGDETHRVCALIDPGAEPEKIQTMIAKSGLKLEKIFLTHGHYDHIGAVAALAESAPELTVYLHPADANKDDPRLFPPLSVKCSHYRDGDTLSLGGLTVQVLHTPGHSAGSVTLLTEDLMLCGDTLFAGSCGRADFPDSSPQDELTSLARLARLDGDYKVCPGHGPLSTLEHERQTNTYMRYALRL